MLLRGLISFIVSLALTNLVYAHEYKKDNLRIIHPHAQPTMADQSSASVCFKVKHVKHAGPVSDELTAVSISPTIAKENKIHSTHDGYCIELLGLQKPLKNGDNIPLTLRFKQAGAVNIEAHVIEDGKHDKKHDSHHKHHEHHKEHDSHH